MEAISDDGSFDASVTRPISEVMAGYSYFRDGDVLRAKVTPCFENGKGALVSALGNGVGFGTTELFVLRPGPEIDGRFLYYLTVSAPFSLLGEATIYGAHGVKRVDDQFVRNFLFGRPPLPEQRAIAGFLDRETARIDELVGRRRRTISCLQESARSTIDAFVLGAASACAWRVRHLVRRIEQGWSPQCDNRPAEAGEWGVLKAGSVNGLDFRAEENKALPKDLSPRQEHLVVQGDILMSRANTRELLGSTALVKEAPDRLLLCDKLYRLVPRLDAVDRTFLVYALNSSAARRAMESEATGSSDSMQNIGQDTVLNIRLPLPSLADQCGIAARIDAELARVRRLTRTEELQVQRLSEHRQALIAAAVTGQIDVRRCASPSRETPLAHVQLSQR